MNFRVSTKHFSLTYPRADISNESLLEFLKSTGKTRSVIVCRELHDDGGYHSHAYVHYESRKDIKNNQYFDFQNNHPNIQATKKINAWKNYCRMDGNYLEYSTDQSDILDIYELAETLEEKIFYTECLAKKVPFQYAKHAWELTKRVSNTITEQSTILGTVLSDALPQVQLEEDLKSIVIIGSAGIGKTTYALKNAKKPLLFATHIDDLKQLRSGYHKTIVFDDMSFCHWPREAQIHLVDREQIRSINIRYGTVSIPAGIHKIFLANTEPLDLKDPAIRRRVVVHRVLN